MEEAPANFWTDILTPIDLGTPNKRKKSVLWRAQEEKVLEYLRQHHPDIYSGEGEDVWFSPVEAARMTRAAMMHARAYEAIIQLRFLIKGLEAGKSLLNWEDVIVPAVPTKVPREPARFTPQKFRELNTLQRLHSAFTDSLEHPLDESPSLHLGSVLISAVLFGGLLDPDWLSSLLRGLPDRIRMNGNFMWLDLQKPYIYPKFKDELEKRKNINRRWCPDPLTQALIIRLYKRYPQFLDECARLDARNCLKVVIRSVLPDKADHLPLDQLYKGAATWLGLRIPSFLVSLATGKTSSVTLPAHVWTRLILDKSVPASIGLDEDEPTDLLNCKLNLKIPVKSDAKVQEKLRKELSILLGDARRNRSTPLPARREVQLFLDKNRDVMAPALQLLCGWAIELLTRLPCAVTGRARKTPLQPSSVSTYLHAVDKGLIRCAGAEDITQFAPEELRGLYDDAIKESRKPEQRINCGQKLFLFHHFLMRNHDVPPVDMNGLIGKKGPPELGVDANLLSPSMFRHLLFTLGWNLPARSRAQEVTCFLAILGYRCGLRQSEARCLRIADIMGETYPELLVRTSIHFRTKTPDAARRIPIHLLLDPEEYEALMQWKRMRIAEEGGNYLTAPLFGTPGDPYPPDENELFPLIREAMRQISGDKKLRYHHLRHSFENRLLLSLMGDELLVDTLPISVREMLLSPGELAALKKDYFGNMDQGRQYLYGVSTLLGHSDPGTTLFHYFHLRDLLLVQMLKLPTVQPQLSDAAIMQVTGLKRAMIFRSKAEAKDTRGVMSSFLDGLARHIHKKFPDPLVNSAKPVELVPPEEMPSASLPDWRIIAHVLSQVQEESVPVERISKRLNISPITVGAWCASANAIRDLKTAENKPRHLTRWQRDHLDQVGRKVCFPERPDLPDIELVNGIFKKAGKLKDEDREKVREGVRLFIRRFSANRHFARFTLRKEALDFGTAMRLIGIPDSMVFVTMFPDTGSSREESDKFQKEFLTELQIHPNQCSATGRYHVKRKEECSIAFVIAHSGQPIKRSNKTVEHVSPYGFRYAMYLLGIAWQLAEFGCDAKVH